MDSLDERCQIVLSDFNDTRFKFVVPCTRARLLRCLVKGNAEAAICNERGGFRQSVHHSGARKGREGAYFFLTSPYSAAPVMPTTIKASRFSSRLARMKGSGFIRFFAF